MCCAAHCGMWELERMLWSSQYRYLQKRVPVWWRASRAGAEGLKTWIAWRSIALLLRSTHSLMTG